MKKYKFGQTNLFTPALSFGGNVFGWTLDEKVSFRMLDELYDKGLTFIDTANNYSHWVPGNTGGESEIIIGKWFKQTGKRQKVVLSTKVGGKMGDGTRGLRGDYIRQCVEDSLRRLNTDYIDLYFSHYDDIDTPQEETMKEFNELVKEGKVRYLGASNLTAERIVSANKIALESGWEKYVALQPLYNLYDRERFETEYLPLSQQDDMAVMSYFALASGFLSGKYRTQTDLENSKRKDMVKGYLNERGMKILDSLQVIASNHNAELAEIAIAWQIQKPEITAPIVSATTFTQLQSLIKSVSLELSDEEIKELERASVY
ncbi:aldo/keto reductase [Myroides indicus]|jgi:aryl-alcohol dehydrogenase-like predicted oxidoreductase|uniref:Aryl-alcohol dehydrogenase-like predicted oxidoreductase n=1 Tax=Myroides indicus TaxID=1323422 RepID=A0A4R7EXH7_9FLAO|nr:aldo/keto reductase [Myroides indicus]TDS58222.1 aryl-alcohol dehydrogenase-like predicted oxidoreductase [Myroides indicus]